MDQPELPHRDDREHRDSERLAAGQHDHHRDPGRVSASVTFTVTAVPALQAVAVTPARPVIAAGGTVTFAATGLYDDGTTRDLTPAATWSSGTTAVATVEGSGVFFGAAAASPRSRPWRPVSPARPAWS